MNSRVNISAVGDVFFLKAAAMGKSQSLIGLALTREVTAEQINAGQGRGQRGLRRRAEIRQIDEEARTVELAFSSEEPVERWFGTEILSHDPGAMRTDRLTNGAALLLNHDVNDQVGVVESVTLGSDRIARATVRFGKSGRADEVFQDVRDGIRRHVSVGYFIHGIRVEQEEGEPDKVTLTDWEPYEISIVAVPADPTVGVGRTAEIAPEEAATGAADTAPESGQRSAGQQSHEDAGMKTKILRDAKGNLVRAKVDDDGNIVEVLEVLERAGEGEQAIAQRARDDAQRAIDEANERTAQILELGETYGAADMAARAVREGMPVADFQRQLLERMNQSRGGGLTGPNDELGLTEREARNFSFNRLIRALSEPESRSLRDAAAFEFDVVNSAAERADRSPKGVLIPIDVLNRAMTTATDGGGAGATGGYLIDTAYLQNSFIDLLRNAMVLMRLATPMGGLVGNVEIPKKLSGTSAYFLGEDDEATISAMELGQIGMTPKTVAALAELTRRLIMQSSLDSELMTRRDLATAIALKLDWAGFYGRGTENEPRGIKNASGINTVNFATAGQPTFAELVKMETEISADNANVDSMAYVFNARMRGHCKTTEKFSGTTGATLWEQGGTVNGYNTEVTNQIATGDVFHGNFSDVVLGMWGGLDLQVDPYTHSARGRVRITAFQDVDIVLRRVESMCYGVKPA